MSRARNIKPGFFENELLAELLFEYRLLFIGLWTLADRKGRLEDRPIRIKMKLFAGDSVDVDAGLQALHDRGFIQRYQKAGQRLIQVTAWAKHQRPHIREVDSILPGPDVVSPEQKHSLGTANDSHIKDEEAQPRHDLGNGQASPRCPDSLIPDSLIPIKAKATGRTTQKKPRRIVQGDPRFEEFWDLYPNHAARANAEKAWARITPADADAILEALPDQVAHDDQWLRGFIPHGATYLNARRWTDPITHPPRYSTGPPSQPSKTMQGIMALEKMKSGNQLAIGRDTNGVAEAALPQLGTATGR